MLHLGDLKWNSFLNSRILVGWPTDLLLGNKRAFTIECHHRSGKSYTGTEHVANLVLLVGLQFSPEETFAYVVSLRISSLQVSWW